MLNRLLSAALLIITLPAMAEPRIVVSIAPLHSLVAALTEGVTTPQLLLRNEQERQAARLSHAQMRQVLQADLILLVGHGVEAPLTQALAETPAAQAQSMMVAHHLPLLQAEAGTPWSQHSHHEDGIARDPRFWLDPRLASLMVHHLTPLLVQLDPVHTERYLDNEIALLDKLRRMETELTAVLAPLAGQRVQLVSGLPAYFYRRFGMEVSHVATGFQPVANPPGCVVTGGDLFGAQLDAGQELYFDLLKTQAVPLAACIIPRARA